MKTATYFVRVYEITDAAIARLKSRPLTGHALKAVDMHSTVLVETEKSLRTIRKTKAVQKLLDKIDSNK